jgi:AraC-like DNA-binding protein
MKVPIPSAYPSLREILTEFQKSNPAKFSDTICKSTGISSRHMNDLVSGNRSFTKDQLLMVSSGLGIDARTLIMGHLKERINQISGERDSARQIRNMTADLNHLDTISFNIATDIPNGLPGRFIESLIHYEGSRNIRNHEKMLPDGVIQLVFLLDDHERLCINDTRHESTQTLKEAWVSGAQKSFRSLIIPQNEKTLTVRFKPGGFFAITGIPASETTHSFIPADQIFGPSVIHLNNYLKQAATPADCFNALKCYLLKQYQKKGKPAQNKLIRLNHIVSRPVQQLADESGISHKHFIQLFKNQIGLTPKYYQRILRFGNTLKEILSFSSYPEWADIVFDNNYYDQSHFINEFRHFSGYSPQSYLETGNTCTKYFHPG